MYLFDNNMIKRLSSSCVVNDKIALLIGIICGYIIGFGIRFATYQGCYSNRTSTFVTEHTISKNRSVHSWLLGTAFVDTNLTTDQNLVLVGVMTTKRFLQTRAVAAYETWINSIPGKVIFFSSEGSELLGRPGIPVVGLNGVDDSYPPQRKSFMMLKYMHDHFLNKFKFYMRADDDIYVRGEVLARFLHSINSTNRALYIGQVGLGKKEKIGRLNLRKTENYCMGGPGMILSRETLARTVPFIGFCINNFYSTHEDVEVGRCICQSANTSCTLSYEVGQVHYIASHGQSELVK